jgi:hypothetical protein
MPFLELSKVIREHWALSLVLLFALIHGIVYVFLIPPWQHYDEPGQLEFAWLVANQDHLPKPGEFDQDMRREVAASMIEHDFFDEMGSLPNILSQSEPIWIGIPQINDRPLYYLLVAAPLRLVRTSDITFQLYLGRLVSLFLYLVTILASYGVMAELTAPDSALHWMVPVTIALLPGFTDLMTAINDDVGATAFFSLFLWAGVRLIQKGFTVPRLLALVATASPCFWTKNTVTIPALLLFIPLLFSIFRGSRRPVAWALLGGSVLVGILTIFAWGNPANWYEQGPAGSPSRTSKLEVPLGKSAFHFSLNPNTADPKLVQVLPVSSVDLLRGKKVTLGAWIWASQTRTVRTPVLDDGNNHAFQEVNVGPSPTYFSYTTTLSEDAGSTKVILSPADVEIDEAASVYYDGIVLVKGDVPLADKSCSFSSDARMISWRGQEYTNFIRNPSAERAWPRVRSWVDQRFAGMIPGHLSQIFGTLLDWKSSTWYFRAAFRQLFQTFWAKFGWAHVPLLGHRPYRVLGVFTIAGLLGAVVGLWRRRRLISGETLVFFACALVLVWGFALMRGSTSIVEGSILVPSARYAYPVVIPTLLILTYGWVEILKTLRNWFNLPLYVQYLVYFGLWLSLDLLSIISIVKFYSSNH